LLRYYARKISELDKIQGWNEFYRIHDRTDPVTWESWARIKRALKRLRPDDCLDDAGGYFSIVLLSKLCPDVVLKISPNKRSDNGWLYMKWARRQTDSLSPMIYDQFGDSRIEFAIMERLVSDASQVEDEDSRAKARDAWFKGMDMGELYGSKYMKRVHRAFNFAYDDLAWENVLYRQDGSLVITDPVAGSKSGPRDKSSTRHSYRKRRQGMIRSLKAAA